MASRGCTLHNQTQKKRGVWTVVPLVGTAALCAGIALFNFLPMLEGLLEM